MICRSCEYEEPSFNTEKANIRFNKMSDVYEFAELVSKCKFDVVVKSGHFAVNGKFVSALTSIDLTESLDVEFCGAVPYDVKEGMKKFITN